MSAGIPDDKIQQMRDGFDIYELVSRYVQLKRSGANHVGLCPFHTEKSPSFSVNPGRQMFKCFGCGVGGDAFEFLMRIEGLSFPEAAQRIAGEMGIDIAERKLSGEEERRRQECAKLQRVNAIAAEFFHRQLLDSPGAENCRQYLNKRGYGRTSASEYQLGYAPDSWDGLTNHLRQQGVDLDEARTLGLIRSRDKGDGDYDLFRGRLIFPIHDLSGQIVAFGGRILGEGQPKYINSPESPIYHKGQMLFGLYGARQAIRQAAEVILVEGYFDQLALARAGVENAVATCGTALTAEHAQLIMRYAKRALLLFDNDKAGRSATFKSMDLLLPTGIEASVIELEPGDDPDSFLQKRGKEAFAEKRLAARPVVELFMQDQLATASIGASGVSRAAQQVLEKLVLLPNPLELDLSLKELARRTEIEVDLLREQLEQIRRGQQERTARLKRTSGLPAAPSTESAPVSVPPPESVPAWQKPPVASKLSPADATLLKMMVFQAEVRQQVATQGVEAFFFDPLSCRLAEELVTRLQDVAVGQELTRLQQTPEFIERLPPLLANNPEEFAGMGQKMLESRRQKTADMRRRQEMKIHS